MQMKRWIPICSTQEPVKTPKQTWEKFKTFCGYVSSKLRISANWLLKMLTIKSSLSLNGFKCPFKLTKYVLWL